MIGESKIRRDEPKSQNNFTWVVWLCVICCFFLIDNVNAQMSQKDVPNVSEPRKTPSGSPIWVPSSALPVKFDWIQLISGEWLKGDFKALYDYKLEFESDEMDLLELDWEDVKQVRGHKPSSVRFEGPMVVVGILKVVDDKVFVIIEEEVLEFDRSRLVSVTPWDKKEIGYWSSKISISLDFKKGNSDQINYSISANAKRSTSESRFFIEYFNIFTELEGVKTAESLRINTYYDIFKTRKVFWRPVFSEYFRDRLSNIENRVNVGTGIGYHLIKTSKTKWDIAPGLAYLYTEYSSVIPGEDPSSSAPSMEISTEYDTELTKMIDLNVTYKFSIITEEAGRYTHHMVTGLAIELTRRLDLRLSFVWDRIQDPKEAEGGRVPEKDDFYLFLGIEFEL